MTIKIKLNKYNHYNYMSTVVIPIHTKTFFFFFLIDDFLYYSIYFVSISGGMSFFEYIIYSVFLLILKQIYNSYVNILCICYLFLKLIINSYYSFLLLK